MPPIDRRKARTDLALINAIQNHDPVGVNRCLRAGADPNTAAEPAPPPGLFHRLKQQAIYSLSRARGVLVIKIGIPRMVYPIPALVLATLEPGSAVETAAIIESLLACGADINSHDGLGNTALLHAANRGLTEVIDLLLIRGADVNKANKGGDTPLDVAAGSAHIEAVRRILQSNPNLNSQDDFGTTPLMAACYNSSGLPVVQMLVEAGADPHLKKSDGNDALAIATQHSHEDMIRYLTGVTRPLSDSD